MHPVRKKNRLQEFDYSQKGAYLITVCTKERKCILSTIVGGDAHIAPCTKLTTTGKVVEKYLRSIPGIDHYVIMPNHVHMILMISSNHGQENAMRTADAAQINVPSLVRSWKTLVSKELGKSIWQRSYYDHVIRDERDYLVKAQYIAENPARWLDDDYYCIE